MILESFDTKVNFWINNPQLKAMGPFKKLHDDDKSKDRTVSSKIMWGVAFFSDRKSKYYNLPENEKKTLIAEDIIEDKLFFTKGNPLFTDLCSFYEKLNETPAMRALKGIEEKLNERDLFLRETQYTLGEKSDKGFIWGTADTLDKMLANSVKVWDLYSKARAIVHEESETKSYGNQTKSLSDSGQI